MVKLCFRDSKPILRETMVLFPKEIGLHLPVYGCAWGGGVVSNRDRQEEERRRESKVSYR